MERLDARGQVVVFVSPKNARVAQPQSERNGEED